MARSKAEQASHLALQQRLQEEAFQAHDNLHRELKRRYDAMTPQERELAAHRRIVERGKQLHARGLPHNCLCHEA